MDAKGKKPNGTSWKLMTSLIKKKLRKIFLSHDKNHMVFPVREKSLLFLSLARKMQASNYNGSKNKKKL